MAPPKAFSGEVWQVNLDPVIGHEQGRTRPALIVSVNEFNKSPAGLVTVVPITSKDRGVRSHVRIDPPEGGLTARSFALCDQVRSISDERLLSRWGMASETTMKEVGSLLRMLLGL